MERLLDHGLIDHGLIDHGLLDHGLLDHGLLDHGLLDHGETLRSQSMQPWSKENGRYNQEEGLDYLYQTYLTPSLLKVNISSFDIDLCP